MTFDSCEEILMPLSQNLVQKNASRSFDAQRWNATKVMLISEAFRPRAVPIRKVLKAQCLQHSEECIHAEPQQYSDSLAFSKAVFLSDISAWFSLQTPGDSAVGGLFTQKSRAADLSIHNGAQKPKYYQAHWKHFIRLQILCRGHLQRCK